MTIPDLNKLRFSIKDVVILTVLIMAPTFYLAGNLSDLDEVKKLLTGLIEGGVGLAILKTLVSDKSRSS